MGDGSLSSPDETVYHPTTLEYGTVFAVNPEVSSVMFCKWSRSVLSSKGGLVHLDSKRQSSYPTPGKGLGLKFYHV